MPCNLAVTITKAAVMPEHLQALLTPEIIEQIVTTYLSSHNEYKTCQPLRSRIIGETVRFYLGSLAYRITITGSQVALNFPPNEQYRAETLGTQLTQLLTRGADRLFASQVQQSLTAKFRNVQAQTATVDNQGTPQKVTVFTLEM